MPLKNGRYVVEILREEGDWMRVYNDQAKGLSFLQSQIHSLGSARKRATEIADLGFHARVRNTETERVWEYPRRRDPPS